jgi:UMF1 family MFS transporter
MIKQKGQPAPEANAARKAVWGWAIYDWANSAFATTVMAGFFPLFFKQYWSVGANVNLSTARLGLANALAGLIVALAAPLLGVIADRGGYKKKFLIYFAYQGVLMTAALALIPRGGWPWAIFAYALGNIGFSGANVFYDAMLPDLALPGRVDFISSLGYALGYLGGGLLFLVNVLMTLHPHFFGLADAAVAVRTSFVSVALWWGCFTIFTIAWVPAHQPEGNRGASSIRQGLRELGRTAAQVRKLKAAFVFLLAYWCYIDGVDTIIRMAVDYGLSLGFPPNSLIVALLVVQFIGFPAALIFGKLGERWGVRRSLFLAIGAYTAITIWGAMMSSTTDFYALAIFVGLVQGGIQALSRSYYTRLIPDRKSAEFFGFYNMLGKFATILGPALMGLTGLTARRLLMPAAASEVEIATVEQWATRLSIISILLLFGIGALLLHKVQEPVQPGPNDCGH